MKITKMKLVWHNVRNTGYTENIESICNGLLLKYYTVQSAGEVELPQLHLCRGVRLPQQMAW